MFEIVFTRILRKKDRYENLLYVVLFQVFVLVYDAANKETFNYVRAIRDQILEVKGADALIVVVGNKQDLCDHRDRKSVG